MGIVSSNTLQDKKALLVELSIKQTSANKATLTEDKQTLEEFPHACIFSGTSSCCLNRSVTSIYSHNSECLVRLTPCQWRSR